ncbi:hypothetical protein [Desulfotalea psychrophila]|uniref:hypothetical protein n=1 Tax=Desulfotalea psychrophila TaxID=84980 RepID=UPI00059B57A1|nr:hypothetical protein [Desulfotalea psychrophila]
MGAVGELVMIIEFDDEFSNNEDYCWGSHIVQSDALCLELVDKTTEEFEYKPKNSDPSLDGRESDQFDPD